MITGWIERNIDKSFFGWLSIPDDLVNSDKELLVYVLGELRWKKSLKLTTNYRADLAQLKNAYLFEFELDETEFYHGASTCTISFFVLCSGQEFPLRVTPQMVTQTIRVAGDNGAGLSFGRVSKDGVAVIGAGGNIFLKAGTNDVEGMYSDKKVVDVPKWIDLILNRHNRAIENNYNYIQVLIPEKSSVIYWNAPFFATKGSPGFNELINAVKDHKALNQSLLSSADFVPDEVHSEGIFRAFDTHMSTLGAKSLVDVFLARFFPQGRPHYLVGSVVFGDARGDIGARESPNKFSNVLKYA